MLYTRRMRILSPFFVLCGLAIFFYLYGDFPGPQSADNLSYTQQPSTQDKEFFWDQIPQRYPVQLPLPVPSVVPGSIAPIQHRFPPEESAARDLQMTRLQAVKGNFTHAWEGYKKYAWMSDEVAPLSGHAQNPFGGWAATLVDALDTLWIMGLYDEFEEAIKAVEKLDFTKCSLDEINVFETTIRFLGGFLGAYDISNQKYHVLLQKAVEVGSMLYAAFDTPNRMPVTRWKINAAAHGAPQEAGNNVLVAEIGSLTLEFTRLSQLTKDSRYFDAVQRIVDVFDAQQDQTKVPGLWPIIVDAKTMNFHAFTSFTIGGMADSLYEYLPKQYILLEGASQQYRKLYQKALTAMKAHIFFRPMAPGSENLLFPGDISSDGQIPLSQLKLEAKVQHLSCFAGGMVAIGAKAFNSPDDLTVARKLVEGCIWGYEHGYLGIMPEIMHTIACDDQIQCLWDESRWHREVEKDFPIGSSSTQDKIISRNLTPGVSKIDDARYILRPEAIESIFILYRITGDTMLVEKAWNMFNTIIKHTITDIAHAGLHDCTVDNPPKQDRMESFWFAETLKYFYLIFSEPDVVSLDKYVLNTEAHPFRRPV